MGFVQLLVLAGAVAAVLVGTALYGVFRSDERELIVHRALYQLAAGALVVYVVAFEGRLDLFVTEVSFDFVGDPGVSSQVGLALLTVAAACYAALFGRWLATVQASGLTRS